MIRSFIPNLLTLMNLLSGAIAIVMALETNFYFASYLILAGAIFDFFDGFAARLLRVSSPIGKQLDSLADLITFGLAPATMLFALLKQHWAGDVAFISYENWAIFTPFFLVLFAALRLAKFNVDESQSKHFQGLPKPANSLFIVSFVFLLLINAMWITYEFVLPIIVVFSFIMGAPIPLMGLKEFSGQQKVYILILLTGSLAALILFKFTAGVIIIPFYIALSGIKFAFSKKQ